MIKQKSFILNNFDENKLINIINYIKCKYKKDSIIYCSQKFCKEIMNNILQLKKEDINKKNLNTSFISLYKGTPIYCIPELNETNAFIVPNYNKS